MARSRRGGIGGQRRREGEGKGRKLQRSEAMKVISHCDVAPPRHFHRFFISSTAMLNMPPLSGPRAAALLPRRAPSGAATPRADASGSASAAAAPRPAAAGPRRQQLPPPPSSKQSKRTSASSSSTSSSSTSSSSSTAKRKPFTRAPDLPTRLADLQELVRDLAGVAASAGPQSAFRGIQAADAVARVGRRAAVEALRPGGRPPSAPALLRRVFEALGATYIKLGQFIASSPSLFPEEYVSEFEALLDRTEPVPWATIRASIERELGGPLERFFESVDEAPLASASVAQVHAAVLKGSRADVVIKVRKPGVDATLSADLGFLYAAARVAEFLNPALGRGSVAAIAGDIRAAMLDEVDFTKEAAHVAEFASYLRATGMESVATCPVVYGEASSKGVLTMSRLRGVPLTDIEAIRSITDVEPEAVLVGALNAWFGSLLAARSFHADVHSGNLLALPDGRVGFIDFGIVGRVAPSTWAAVRALVASTASGDYDTMARALAAMGALGEEKQVVGGRGGGRRAGPAPAAQGLRGRTLGSLPTTASSTTPPSPPTSRPSSRTRLPQLPRRRSPYCPRTTAPGLPPRLRPPPLRLPPRPSRSTRPRSTASSSRSSESGRPTASASRASSGSCSSSCCTSTGTCGSLLRGSAWRTTRGSGSTRWRRGLAEAVWSRFDRLFFSLSIFFLLLLVLHRAFFLIVSLCNRTWRDSRLPKEEEEEGG